MSSANVTPFSQILGELRTRIATSIPLVSTFPEILPILKSHINQSTPSFISTKSTRRATKLHQREQFLQQGHFNFINYLFLFI
jgi:hypothetical protein